ncbi:MAG: NADP-dependent malic enzyme [Acidobacteria bacterium]|nr:NADP-dependent malic enzyme [Acidobacteriota bacterium]
MGRKGKIEVIPSKPCATARDLSLAYSPGVAEPCLEIARDPALVYEYTAKGNLVGVISNGTAVLGLGDIGPLAGKPVMEGKGVLFKRFADIDVFDIEVDEKDVDKFVETVARLEPTFGGINLEDIKAPECFAIEEALKKRMGIPVFHDDQHGTAIISAAAFLNALEIVDKKIDEVKVVFAGAGAAAIACANLYLTYGVRLENILMVDRKGVIWNGRTDNMNPYKQRFARDTDLRTIEQALEGADAFIGVSSAGLVTGDMIKRMARDPIVFAMANPVPEILPEAAKAARPDVLMATGRSDYPNQVNNVLGFPFIFRGALDCGATQINEAMKLAASKALADLAKEDVPDSVARAYGVENFSFGREYLIPKPFDWRVLLRIPPAVAAAAAATGVARKPIQDMEAYSQRLEGMLSRSRSFMHVIHAKARRNPLRVVFAEGDHPKIQRAAKILAEEGIATPILLSRGGKAIEGLDALDLKVPITVLDPEAHPRFNEFADAFHEKRKRLGVTREDAVTYMRIRNYFAAMMVDQGAADVSLSGLTTYYPETIRPALQTIGVAPGVKKVSGLYVLILQDRAFFFADTTVNIDPTAEDLAEIAVLSADAARHFNITPRIAMVSFSNFGSVRHPVTDKVREAVRLVKGRRPDLECDGEMQADAAVMPGYLEENYPWAGLSGPANVLVFPELQSANAAYKLVWRLAKAEAIGPILMGLAKPVHVLQRGVEVTDIVNMAAYGVVDAQERSK